MLVEYVKDNYFARFHDPSCNRYRERHFSILLDVKLLTDGRTNGRKVGTHISHPAISRCDNSK